MAADGFGVLLGVAQFRGAFVDALFQVVAQQADLVGQRKRQQDAVQRTAE